MPQNTNEKVESLHLDLGNFRTVRQPDEEHAINALIGIEPDRFWALMESLLEDGYSPTENVIVLDTGSQLVVKEGNRRVAALKLILGLRKDIELPEHIQNQIQQLGPEWKTDNAHIPCAIYEQSESGQVDKLVARTHAKGQKAGRVDWPAIAKARYARDQNNEPETGLDLLEKYLSLGKTLTPQQAERWAGEYPLTVLDEAIQKIAPLVNLNSAADVVASYPAKNRKLLDRVLHDIGMSQLGFKELRAVNPFWGTAYGLALKPQATSTSTAAGKSATASTTQGRKAATAASKKAQAHASTDPTSVRQILRRFKIRGSNRDKVVTLLEEIKALRHENHPHAFCFVLRSMFELSAKAYCADHRRSGGPSMKKADGSDKNLATILRDIHKHLTKSMTDKDAVKRLHGAMTELGKTDGILSVTSMNQLVHNPSFSIAPADISLMFWRIFPLLEAMNT